MNYIKALFLGGFLFCSTSVFGQSYTSLTDSLVHVFHESWNSNDLEGMLSMLQPDAFFKSPHQLRYSRDTMAVTVLKKNPPVIKDCISRERYSEVQQFLAWSIGDLYCNIYFSENGQIQRERTSIADGFMMRKMYDEEGNFMGTQKQKGTAYLYLFTRKDGEDWKVQMLVYHEPIEQ